MKPIRTASSLRSSFLSFFRDRSHLVLPSSSVVPHNDPSLLFINSGMAPLKSHFLSLTAPPATLMASSQICVRAGGKHNDLDQVGHSARHLTCFEMLGNFAIPSPVNHLAVQLSWSVEVLTTVFGLDASRLSVTVLEGDSDTERAWRSVFPSVTVRELGKEDNFWSVGETGPCGPCTEVFYDRGREVDGDRLVEVWNIVMMRNRRDRGEGGEVVERLADRMCLDTGMGLERIAAVCQGVDSVFEIDSFRPIIEALSRGLRAPAAGPDTLASIRVLADHMRAATVLVASGVVPGSQGRGYVLRRILRRAARHAHAAGLPAGASFVEPTVRAVAATMADVYPELAARAEQVTAVLVGEVESFAGVMARGSELLRAGLARAAAAGLPLDPATAFELHDSIGFPLELTALAAAEARVALDTRAVEALIGQQRERSRAVGRAHALGQEGGAARAAQDAALLSSWDAAFPSLANAAPHLATAAAVPECAVLDASPADGRLLLIDPCPFYPVGGGQVGDRGNVIVQPGGKRVAVLDTLRSPRGLAVLVLEEPLPAGSAATVHAEVDMARRRATAIHHSATHLLHHALRARFGPGVAQAGSLVGPEGLRFDFSHPRPLSDEDVAAVEAHVDALIARDDPLAVEESETAAALASGAIGLFSAKYGERVRVVGFGPSRELCGGTHASSTGQLGALVITSKASVAAGTRRIEAVAGPAAVALLREKAKLLRDTAQALKVPEREAPARATALLKQAHKPSASTSTSGSSSSSSSSSSPVVAGPKTSTLNVTVSGARVIVHALGSDDEAVIASQGAALTPEAIQAAAFRLHQAQPGFPHVVMQGRLIVVVADPTTPPTAKEVLKFVTDRTGGKGGGTEKLARGTLNEADNAHTAINNLALSIMTR